MIRKYVVPAVAVFGLLFGVFMMVATTKPAVQAKPVAEPAKAPFAAYVAGAGLIEAATENVKVGTPTGGLVTQVLVKAGDRVHKGQPLWQLDDGPKRAELAKEEAALAAAEATLDKLRQGTRPEEAHKQEAQVQQAAAQLEDARAQLQLREAAAADEARAVSRDELNQARHAVQQREAALAYQQAELDRLRAGTWAPEIRIQEAAVQQARAQVRQTQTDLDRLTIRSPLDGEVLQVKLHIGEYAPAAQTDDALMLLGNQDVLNIRVDVDEQDGWRIERQRKAVASPQGRGDLRIPLQFVRIEPYVLPKKSLTGASTERVDTRVLQVLYRFRQPHGAHLYVGQQMDVFIEANPLADPGTAETSKGPATRSLR